MMSTRDPRRYRVKVSAEVHNKLLELQQTLPLSFNDIIAVGLSMISDQTDKSLYIGMDVVKVTVNIRRMKVPYDIIESLIDNGSDMFIPGISSRKASYLRRKIQERFNIDVFILSSSVESEFGFLFIFKPLNDNA